MKVLLNATTATKGGALHLATLLVRHALLETDGVQWCIAISSDAKRQVDRILPGRTGSCRVFHHSPARNWVSRRLLRQLETETRPDCVFTPYGPAYVRFNAPHLLGVAVPWVTHPSLLAYRMLDFPHEWIRTLLSVTHKRIWYRRADAWWVETPTARQGLVRRLGLPCSRISVVPNTCGPQYRQRNTRRAPPELSREIKLLYFTAPYKHKNLNMVPRVARELANRAPHLKIRVVTTLPEDGIVYRRMMRLARTLGVADLICNRGPIPVADGPGLYQECDICFMPTVLEVFSAAYVEAMAMGLPIVTSDLEFAHDSCGAGARYFLPNDAASAAESVLGLLHNPNEWEALLDAAKQALRDLPTPEEKYRSYVTLLSKLVEGLEFD